MNHSIDHEWLKCRDKMRLRTIGKYDHESLKSLWTKLLAFYLNEKKSENWRQWVKLKAASLEYSTDWRFFFADFSDKATPTEPQQTDRPDRGLREEQPKRHRHYMGRIRKGKCDRGDKATRSYRIPDLNLTSTYPNKTSHWIWLPVATRGLDLDRAQLARNVIPTYPWQFWS